MATGLGRQCMDMATSVHHMIAMQAGEKHRVLPLRTNGGKWMVEINQSFFFWRNIRKLHVIF